MEEAPLRLQPQAYGATIGPSGRLASAKVRLAAVCAALVSLLAVCCVVLTSGQPTQHGLPGFELSLNSAMETFFKNTAAREQHEAKVQQHEMSRLAVAPHSPLVLVVGKKQTQGLAAVANKNFAASMVRSPVTNIAGASKVRLTSEAMHRMTAVQGSRYKKPAARPAAAAPAPLAHAAPAYVAPPAPKPLAAPVTTQTVKHSAPAPPPSHDALPAPQYAAPPAPKPFVAPAVPHTAPVTSWHTALPAPAYAAPPAPKPSVAPAVPHTAPAPAASRAPTHSAVAPNANYVSGTVAPKKSYVDHYLGSYVHPPAEHAPGGSSPGVVRGGATEHTLNNLKSQASMQVAQTERLASKPFPEGLSNKPWSAPASDFNAPKSRSRTAPQTADFDVPVPKGMHTGQVFLVQIPGHREREVTVPAGVAPGQLVSIDVPAVMQLSNKRRTKLESEEPAAEVQAAKEPDVESVEEADSAEESGEAATIESAAKRMHDYATVPVVFGGTPEQQAAASAVNAVHDLFRKDETVSTKWIPGDTQPIPGLQPLGQTSEDQWTSAPEVYGDQTALHAQSCAARCAECKTMGPGNWNCQKCGDVCNQLSDTEVKLKTYSWKVGAPRGAIDPIAQAELPPRYFRAVGVDKDGYTMKQPMIPAKKRWYQKTTQVTHVTQGGITQITSNPKWPVQSTAGLSSIANLYKPDGELPSNLPTMSSLATVEGRAYKHSLLIQKQRKQTLQEDEETPAEGASDEEPSEGDESMKSEEGQEGKEGAIPKKQPGFVVATPDDQGLEHGAVARKMTTNVNVIGPGGPSYVQIHTMAAENPQHFGAYAKPNFRSEYPTTQTITVNPSRPFVRVVAHTPQFVSPQSVFAVPRPATAVITSYQPAAMAAKQQTIETTMGSGGLIFQVPTAPGIAVAPGAAYSQTTTVNRVQPQWGAPSISATTVTTAQAGAPVQYIQAPVTTMRYVQGPAAQVMVPTGGTASSVTMTQTGAMPMQVVAAGGSTVQVVSKETAPNYQSLSPIPSLQPMSFFNKKKRAKKALFRHWDGHEMQVLNVLSEKSDGAINLDPQDWQGQNLVISEGANGEKADQQFSEAMAQVTQGLHAAANSELHYKGNDRTGVTYHEYGDVNPAISQPVDPARGGPKLIHSDPFALRPKIASSPLASINDRAGAVPTGAQMVAAPASDAKEHPADEGVPVVADGAAKEVEVSMVVKVPAGLRSGQEFTAMTGAGNEEEVTVPAGVKAGGEVEISVPRASQ